MAAFLPAQTVYVPLNHWSYDFLERLETQKMITGVLNGTRPMTRQEMAGYLIKVLENPGIRLNSVETEQLNFLQQEFAEEFASVNHKPFESAKNRIARFKKLPGIDSILPDFLYRNNRNFLSFEQEAFKCFIDPVLYREALFAAADTLTGTEKVWQDQNGFTFWGTLGPQLGFCFDTRDTKESGTRTYPAVHKITRERLGFVNGYTTHIYHDETVAYFLLTWPWFKLMYGKDENRWGMGAFGNLILSDYATSYDQIKFQVNYWRIKFTSLTGFLRAYPSIYENNRSLEKSFAAHRLEINLFNSLQLGFQETVIYGGRRLEPAYLNPIMFYRSAEHYLAYEDNVAMGVDFDWSAIKNLKLYGELLIDDITTTELGTGFYGNKLGYQLGLFYVNVAGIQNLDGRLEYARLRPYVYTHKLPITTYQHFTTSLGHRIGPNSDEIALQLKYRFSKAFLVESKFQYQRWGANVDSLNFGRDIVFAHRYYDPEYVDFLAGARQALKSITLQLSYELFRNFYMQGEYRWARLTGEPLSTEQSLPLLRQQAALAIGINF